MSTFLQLCSSLRREAGISGSGPTTVLSQSGEMLRVVEWVKAAYEYVQNLHPNWSFLRTEFALNTATGTATYEKDSGDIEDLGEYKSDSLRIYKVAIGVSDEQELEYVPWDQFRTVYIRSTSGTLQARPTLYSIKPDQSLMFWPIPDAVYKVTGEYFKAAQTLTADTSVPIIPAAFHNIIVWKALMLYGAYAGSQEAYAHGQNEYRAALSKLVLNQLPKVGFGAPLA